MKKQVWLRGSGASWLLFFLDVSAKGCTAQEAVAEAGKAWVVLVFPWGTEENLQFWFLGDKSYKLRNLHLPLILMYWILRKRGLWQGAPHVTVISGRTPPTLLVHMHPVMLFVGKWCLFSGLGISQIYNEQCSSPFAEWLTPFAEPVLP